MTICVICISIEEKQVFLVYFTAPCRVNKTKNLISGKVYRNGTKAVDLRCEKGFQLIGVINRDWPVCFNGTWKIDGTKFPYCEAVTRKIQKVEYTFWDILSSFGG